MTRKPAESATARLARLLTMVPWLLGRRGIDIDEAAAGLGITPAQLEADLSLLFLCGYGQMPDELIDAQWESGYVYVDNADAIARPLRLAVDEAVTLIVGLRALRAVPGLGARDAIDGALAKLEAAAGGAVDAAARLSVELTDRSLEGALVTMRAALARRRRLHLVYLVAGRDERTERDVDPMRLLNLDGRWYLEGWCHRATAVRLFRLDRVESAQLLEVDGTPPEQARGRDLAAGSFLRGDADTLVTLHLGPGAEWVADYYPYESREDLPDGRIALQLRTGETSWIARLMWRLGGRARVVEPAELAADVADGARRALAAYGEGLAAP